MRRRNPVAHTRRRRTWLANALPAGTKSMDPGADPKACRSTGDLILADNGAKLM